MASIGRNEKCPCGSGQKFKKCCLPNGFRGAIEASHLKLKERSQRSAVHREKEFLYFRDVEGVRKMSEILIEFAHPILDKTDGSLESQKKALTTAIIAWNMSLMGDVDDQIEKLHEHMNLSEGDQFANDLTLIVNSLVQRKLDFYSEVQRMVMDYDIVETGDGFHLNVVSRCWKDDKDAEVFRREAEKLYGTKESVTP